MTQMEFTNQDVIKKKKNQDVIQLKQNLSLY